MHSLPNVKFYDFIRPFGLQYSINNNLQHQDQQQNNNPTDLNLYFQNQFGLLPQNFNHQINPENVTKMPSNLPRFAQNNNMNTPKPYIEETNKPKGNKRSHNQYSSFNKEQETNTISNNNLVYKQSDVNDKTNSKNSKKFSRTSSTNSLLQDTNLSDNPDDMPDDTYTTLTEKSEDTCFSIGEDDQLNTTSTTNSTKIERASSPKPQDQTDKHNFTLHALDLALYGYMKKLDMHSLGGAISGLKVPFNFDDTSTESSLMCHSKDKSTSRANIELSKKQNCFSIDNLLTNNFQSNKEIELNEFLNENEKFPDLPEDIEIQQIVLPDTVHYGMFCKRTVIVKGTRFGPYPGKLIYPNEIKISDDNSNMWEIFVDGRLSHYIGGKTNLNSPTGTPLNYWMIYVNCARFAQEQNLIAVQSQGEIYYEGQELLVWYGDSYLQFLGIPVSLKDMTDEQNEDTIENKDGYTCDRCGKVFAYKYYRDKHLKYTRCVDQGNRKFPCHLCSRSFEKRDRLRIHILHVHEKHRPHKCNVCGKSFSQSSSLNKHMRVHSGERPYKCIYCNKAFTASSILRTHIRQHSGEKPFKCKYCGKAFASHAAHDSHVRRTHFITKEKDILDN